MMRHFSKILMLIVVISVFSCKDNLEDLQLQSPDGKITVIMSLDDMGQIYYEIRREDQLVLSKSALNLELQDGLVTELLELREIDEKIVDERYSIPVGKSREARNHYREVYLKFNDVQSGIPKLNIFFRAYNDGVAFRYELPKFEEPETFQIMSEKSEFIFPENSKCWALKLKNFNTNYESEFDEITLNNIQPGDYIACPLTVELKSDLYVLLSEADLTDYAAMYLEAKENSEHTIVSRLSPHPDSSGICVSGMTPFLSPWRVLMITESAGELIESNLISNLNDSCEIEDTDWIKPGRVAWPWWSGRIVTDVDFEGGMNTETMKYYTDFAAEYDLEYLLIDAKWYGPHKDPTQDITTSIPEIDMPEILAYAKERNVDVMIWLNWENTRKQMDEAFTLYESWGIKGVKIDYMNRDDQEIVNFYQDVVKKAAEHHLLVDFHGAYKPTGFRRTYPNFITREGIMGLEHTKWSKRVTPEHNVTIPFTRMVTGPMDYTPGAFWNVTPDSFKSQYVNPMAMGTRAHHLAMYVVYDSPLQMISDHPAAYKNQIGADFLKHVPASWDETRVLAGKIGDYVAIARRSGQDWYIGVMTDWDHRSLDIPLSFLNEGDYEAVIYKDGENAAQNPEQLSILTKSIHKSTILTAEMASGGGYVVYLKATTE